MGLPWGGKASSRAGVTASVPPIQAVEAALAAGELNGARALAREAVERGVLDPLVLRLAAEAALEEGKPDEAMLVARRGLSLGPKNVALLVVLGTSLRCLDRAHEAAKAFRSALAEDPSSVEASFGMAESLALAAEVEGALKAFARTIELDPRHVRALAGLSMLLARTGQPEPARAFGERALALAPADAEATAALAAADIADRRYADAESRLNALPEDPDRPLLFAAVLDGLRADAAHGLGRAPEAFAAYAAGHAKAREALGPALEAASTLALENLGRLAASFAKTPREAWSDEAEVEAAPAFLVGFHRSGTTLLEQVLGAHPQISALSEQPTLLAADTEFLDRPGGLEALARLEVSGVERLRRGYFAVAREAGAEPGLLLDKAPLGSISLPIVARLFPGARVLIARRDPRDVVLSAFRQAFAPNRYTYAMLTIEGTATLYDRVMRLLELYQERLPLAFHEVRYERLVEDLEGEARAALAFLGLDWDPAVLTFAENARERLIATPSAAQVRRGVYVEESPWRAYREQLAPVLPILQPWVKRFGYPTD